MNYLITSWIILLYVSDGVFSFSTHRNVFKKPLNWKKKIVTCAKDKSVSELILDNYDQISSLSNLAPKFDNITLLRYVITYSNQPEKIEQAILNTVNWREGPGKMIVDSAEEAVYKANAEGYWDNEYVWKSAPHHEIIKQFINEKNVLTMINKDKDLIYIIKSNMIDDNSMMSKLTVKQVSQFLAYVKEVHHIVANKYSIETNRLCKVIFVNDVSGIMRQPNPDFSKALSVSSKEYEKYYPLLARETLILNLPFILQAFVTLFKPLFPNSIQESLIFKKAPYVKSVTQLTSLTEDIKAKNMFLDEINSIIK